MAASAQPTEPLLRGSVNKQQIVYIILEITSDPCNLIGS